MRRRRAARRFSSIASFAFIETGFSQKTWSPASIAALAISKCESFGVQIVRKSTLPRTRSMSLRQSSLCE